MKLSQLQKGYWTVCDDQFINHYETLEEAEGHIKFQKEDMCSEGNWSIIYLNYKQIKK